MELDTFNRPLGESTCYCTLPASLVYADLVGNSVHSGHLHNCEDDPNRSPSSPQKAVRRTVFAYTPRNPLSLEERWNSLFAKLDKMCDAIDKTGKKSVQKEAALSSIESDKR